MTHEYINKEMFLSFRYKDRTWDCVLKMMTTFTQLRLDMKVEAIERPLPWFLHLITVLPATFDT